MKKVLIIMMIILSLNVFSLNVSSENIYVSKEIINISDFSDIGVWISYSIDKDLFKMNMPTAGINFNDRNVFFTTQKVFFRTIKLKVGERYFNVDFGYDFEKNSIMLATTVKKYKNDLISKSFSYSYKSVFKGGSNSRTISLTKTLIPTVAKFSSFSTGYNNMDISNYGVELQRYFTIPLVIGVSNLGYSLSLPIGVFDDKYISGYFAYGILYKDEFSPFFNFQSPLRVNKADYYMGLQLKMSNDSNFLIYFSKLNIDNPFTILITKNGGSFFFEY
ncbi:hypothetical protein SAMN02745164_01578 [Marinitoga hydrogenitolerans DSM 16785]|uniref:Uncharacterized protein n=1 Tax=Marinitoga hydrogenitolerans (strain DSM 16785 / JCM 12826 / AT1271) TaxID=1122195 RepID=A0A1M4Y302_MARH1|nr:hypothetical protein [Marinitoga hydrogenitolerans]SHF00075.1 hypothetical protein SAMN02745164_01578 [Marinitoga hydrogenitolerans DSM 16785]